ncbi:MAG: P27 family phage terminase small subunit [Colwellia sp.]
MQTLKNNPPAFLRTEQQLDYYNQVIDLLVDSKVPIREQDSFAIGTMALNLALLDECAESIADHGMMMNLNNGRGGVAKVNPAVAMQKEAQTALRFYYPQFQMSPNSRGNNLGAGLGQKGKGEKSGIGSIKVKSKS